jgi:hypothetical protein
LLSQPPQRFGQPVNKRAGTSGEMERAHVHSRIVRKFVFDSSDVPDNVLRHVGQPDGGRRWNETFPRAHEQLRLQFSGETVELKTHSSRREIYTFGCSGNAAVLYYGQEEL